MRTKRSEQYSKCAVCTLRSLTQKSFPFNRVFFLFVRTRFKINTQTVGVLFLLRLNHMWFYLDLMAKASDTSIQVLNSRRTTVHRTIQRKQYALLIRTTEIYLNDSIKTWKKRTFKSISVYGHAHFLRVNRFYRTQFWHRQKLLYLATARSTFIVCSTLFLPFFQSIHIQITNKLRKAMVIAIFRLVDFFLLVKN